MKTYSIYVIEGTETKVSEEGQEIYFPVEQGHTPHVKTGKEILFFLMTNLAGFEMELADLEALLETGLNAIFLDKTTGVVTLGKLAEDTTKLVHPPADTLQ